MKMKRFLGMLLAICMIISMMPVHTLHAHAASTPSVLYMKPNSNWTMDNARFAAYFFNSAGGTAWASMTDADSDGTYEVTVPAGMTTVIFCRMNPSATANNWNNKWNQTLDLPIPSDGTNCYTVKSGTWEKGGGTWSTVGPSSGGGSSTTVDYYLFGYINAADYGDGDDYATLGKYKFVDGKLTTTFPSDSYVGVKTGDLSKWYMTNGFYGAVTTATLYDTSKYTFDKFDKLMVPGGVEVTFTLVVNDDNTVTLSYVADTELIDDQSGIQDGVTLHCWNWSFANIEANMELIASLGYTAIQTSPIQAMKEATEGKYSGTNWWVFYQPVDFVINTEDGSALGTKSEFESMCAKAEEYGIKVIVDVVANHLGNQTGNDLSSAIPSYLLKDAYWHDYTTNTTDYTNRYDITQHCMAGLPDLNTANKELQGYVLDFLKECIDAGADGFRFDAAKHIETPEDDSSFASDFWPTVIGGAEAYAEEKGFDLYCYGELLDAPGGDKLPISAYTKYMSITDNVWGNSLRGSIVGGSASAITMGYYKATSASQLVLWAESHDTYANSDGGSTSISAANINKTWALVAARADAMGLYFARPNSLSTTLLGAADVTGWANDEVKAVNKFHNAFAGQGETVGSSGTIAYVVRGTTGVVLVNASGTSKTVSGLNVGMTDGTYTDQVSGSTFTVADGKISGSIGSTGIAVVYNAECDHDYEAKVTAPTCTEDGYTTYTCSECGDSYTADPTTALGHDWVEGSCSVCEITCTHSYTNGFCGICEGYEPAAGSGTEEDPYLIGNAGQLYWFAAVVNAGYGGTPAKGNAWGTLTADIVINEGDVSGCNGVKADDWREWTPMGRDVYSADYKGTFDGNGKTISGLYIYDVSGDSTGLFRHIESSGKVQNLGIINSYVCGAAHTGAVVGFNEGTVSGCYNEGTVCCAYNADTVTDSGYVGGVVGWNHGSISDCHNSGTVSSTSPTMAVGGVVGATTSTGGSAAEVTGCYNTGNVTGVAGAGGVAGYATTNVTNCYNTGNITSTKSDAGGIAGGTTAVIKKCYNTGKITGYRYVGGVVGDNDHEAILRSCYNTGNVVNNHLDCGGIAGRNRSIITNCYSIGGVEGDNAGGIAGYNSLNGEISNCYYDVTVFTGKGIGDNSGTSTNVVGVNPAAFTSGEVAYLLQSVLTEQIWGQNIDNDKELQVAPVFSEDVVYQGYLNCKDNVLDYSNSELSQTVPDHNYVDGSCDVCGAVQAIPTITPKNATLSLKDSVCYNIYFLIENLDVSCDDMGLLIWNSGEPTDPSFESAEVVIEGVVYDAANGRYKATSDGVAAKDLADAKYMVIYAKQADGTYVYSKVFSYSGKRYATSTLASAKATDDDKTLAVALMNYGAAAQEYFASLGSYTYDVLMNADISAEYQELVAAYDASLVDSCVVVDDSKAGAFAATAGITKKTATATLGSTFGLNVYVTTAEAATAKLYYWTAADYAAAEELTAENASGSVEMTLGEDGRYKGSFEGIAAKEFDETVYIVCVFETGGQTVSTGVISYSIGTYVLSCINKNTAEADMAKAAAVYGYHAKTILGK